MKKCLSMILALAMTVSLAACGGARRRQRLQRRRDQGLP